jgi:hypothetical protein
MEPETALETIPPALPVAPRALPLAAIEERMLQEAQVEIPVEHVFSGGVYVRQVTIPAGCLVMGKRHRHETCNILIKGVLMVYTSETSPPLTVTAPCVFTTPPYTKKFAYCLEEAVFLNVLPTPLTDVDEIERQFIIPEPEYLALKESAPCLLSPPQ